MEQDEALTRAEARALLAYADVTYRAVTSLRRRVATVALAVAVMFGVASIVSTVQWASTRSDVAAVADDPLVDVLGVQIPDPRPAIERAQLRVQMLLWGFGALATAAPALVSLAVYLIVRTPPVPAAVLELQRAEARPGGAGGQPPM